MEKYAYYIVMACAFGGCTLKEKEPNKCSQEENLLKLNLESLSVNPQYTCNNKTFDWVVKTMIAKIAQQVEEIGELESKLLEKQQEMKRRNEVFNQAITQLQESEKQIEWQEQVFEQEREQLLSQIDNIEIKLAVEVARQKSINAKEHLQAKDCSDIQHNSYYYSGLYTIYPTSTSSLEAVEVFCDLQTDGGGWLLLQRRLDGSQTFQKNWEEYKQGFGQPAREFWIGNELIHLLTRQRSYELRFDMTDYAGHIYSATYDFFYTESEAFNYTLRLGEYSGNAGDSLSQHTNQAFSTVDRDNDNSRSGNCAELYGGGGWWYDRCYDSNLNGIYTAESSKKGIVWYHLELNHQSLRHVEMKMRPTLFKYITKSLKELK